MNANGKGVKRLTHTKVDPLDRGALPDRLVGLGQPAADRVRRPGHELRGRGEPEDRRGKEPEPRQHRDRLRGGRADPDGKTVLGYIGGFEGGSNSLKIAIGPLQGRQAEGDRDRRRSTRPGEVDRDDQAQGTLTVLLAVAALLALPAAANATLSYTKGFQKPRVYVAEDNGKGARQIGVGTNSHVSPDGEWVAYERESKGGTSELRLYQVAIAQERAAA